MSHYLLRPALAAVLAACSWAAPVSAAPVCLDNYTIKNTSIPDSHTIVFHMKDGSAWRNTLKNPCPDLRFYGFVFTDSGGVNQYCGNQTVVRVIHSGEVCMLGEFSKMVPPPHL
jgi:hypothetical protein